MKTFLCCLFVLLGLSGWAGTSSTIHGLPNKAAPANSDMLPIDDGLLNWHITIANLRAALGTSTNQSVTTNWVVYGSNYYAGDTYVSNFFATNIFNDIITTNYFNDYVYTTNTYQTNVTIEEYMYYNSYVSNYVYTNIINNTYTSNYFATNLFPTTNLYVTNNIGGAYIYNLNGFGTNTSFAGDTSFIGLGNGQYTLFDTNDAPIAGYNGWYFWGDGRGLYNLNVQTTNIMNVFTNAYFYETNFVNWTVTTNFEVISNAYFYETNFVNWDITTNLTVISNATVRGNLTINNIRLTNGFYRVLTTWVGPTNSLDVGTNFWIYTAPSDCAITNFTGGIAGFASDTALVVTNAATSNITFRITASGNFLDYTNSYTVTNGDVLHLAIERQGTAGADVVGRTGHPL